MSDFDLPMGNVELRLKLQSIETIAIETRDQAMRTNGTVKWQTKMIYLAVGALAILMPIAGWLSTSVIKDEAQIAALKASQVSISSQVSTGVAQALQNYEVNK